MTSKKPGALRGKGRDSRSGKRGKCVRDVGERFLGEKRVYNGFRKKPQHEEGEVFGRKLEKALGTKAFGIKAVHEPMGTRFRTAKRPSVACAGGGPGGRQA